MNKVPENRKEINLVALGIICTLGVIVSTLLVGFMVYFFKQYNFRGNAKRLEVQVNDSNLNEIAHVDGKIIYTYNTKMPKIRKINGKKVSLKKGLEENQVSTKDLCRGSTEVGEKNIQDSRYRIYVFDNYQVMVKNNSYYIITPKGTMKLD